MTRTSDAAGSAKGTSLGRLQALIRFAIELAMLAGTGYWGWSLSGNGTLRVLLAITIPAAAATLWATLRTPGDDSAGKPPVFPISGKARLALEWLLFGLAVYGTWNAGSRAAAETLLTITVLHYALTWPRIRWLLAH